MKTAVIILNWNGEEHLREFLPSVVANTPAWIRIIVADNGSTDGSTALLERDFSRIETIRLDKNYGFAEGYNRALNGLADDCFILLNSDVQTTSGWIEPLIEALDSDPRLGAVAPKIMSYREREKFEYAGAAGGFIDAFGYPFCRGRILKTIEIDHGQYDDFRTTFWATGACMAVRRELFTEVGGFDARFFAHFEEIDLCWRAQLFGWTVGVEPRSVVYHLGGGTLGAQSPFKLYLNYRNNLAMLYKNGRPWVVTLRMVLDGVSALVYLLAGKRTLYKEVLRAHRDFRSWKPELRRQRTEIRRRTVARPVGVYCGSIVLRYIFGRRKFGKII